MTGMADDLAHCRRLLRRGSRSFHAASLLLPARVRDPASALYAFCRMADDAVDDGGSAARLAELHARLDAAYAGDPHDHPVDRAFAAVVRRHDVPRALPEALLEGFAWDLAGRRYASLAALEAYAARVAGTVGVMMTILMGTRAAGTLARAADLGLAMQLTNIARDVGEDARAGRLYLPLEWLAAEGLDPEALLRAPAPSEGLARVVARLLAAARQHYERALPGIADLPRDCRPAIHAARLIYAAIGADIARHGHDSVTRRAVVPAARKLALIAQAFGRAAWDAGGPAAPPADANRFLVAAAARGSVAPEPTALGLVLDLFERMAWRDRGVPLSPLSREMTRG